MEVMRGSSKQEDAPSAVAHHVSSDVDRAEDKRPTCAEIVALASVEMLRDAGAVVLRFAESAVTVLVTAEGHSGVKRAEDGQQAMLQGLFNWMLDKKLNSIEFDGHLLRKIEEATRSLRQMKKATLAMFEKEDIIAPVATLVNKKLERPKSRNGERRLTQKICRGRSQYRHTVCIVKQPKMAKKIAMQMMDRTFFGKDPTLVIAFLQKFKSSRNACKIDEIATMWLSKQFLTGPDDAAVKARITLRKSARFYHEGVLKLYSAIVQILLKRYVTDDNEAKLDAELQNLKERSICPVEYVQELWKAILSCRWVYNKKSLKALFVRKATL